MSHSLHLEQERLAAVHALQWLETAHTENFERICRLAATYFKVPTVLISLVERDRQWFLGRVGFTPSETPIEVSFCRHTIAQPGVMQVQDARLDPRFSNNALVVAPEGICFYAGAPLRDSHGRVLGSLCVIDSTPRELATEEITALQDFADMVMLQIEQRQLLNYCDPVTRLPNLQQLLIDTQGLSLPGGQERLVMVIQVPEHQWNTDFDQDHSLSRQPLKRHDTAQRLRHALASVGQVYHVHERDFCVQLSYTTAQHQEFFRGLVAMIADCLAEQAPRVGLATCADGVQSVESLFLKATQAVGVAAGLHTPWAMYDEVQDLAQRRALRLINDFTAALGNGDMYLEYQPRFSLHSGRMLSAEALIGWHHPTLGKVSPAEFIPLLEGCGKISTVTRWVIDRALSDLAGCADREVRFAVNLSPLDFRHMDIAATLQAACQRHGLAPTRLEVEITEGAWIRDDPQVIEQLKAIRALGVDVAIDDFGTGYSNFAYLHEIPANVLKLDKSFITDLEDSPRNQIIAQSVFQLASKLGYRTVSEGIETFRCLSLVREFGCDEAQGYFMSRPLGLERFKRHCGDIPLAFCPDEVVSGLGG